MIGTRQSLPLSRGRSILALSTLALLALWCLPVLANASSAGYQYEDAPQTATGKPPSESDLTGGGHATSGVGPHSNKGSTDGGNDGGKSADGKGSPQNAGGGDGDNANGQQHGQAKPGESTPGSANLSGSTEPGSDGGGSSPLIPILIAIVVLAGGSIAYVVIKRRRSGDSGSADSPGSSPSPEAS